MNDLHAIIGVLRAQSWQRAKAELESVLESYVDDGARYLEMDKLVRAFISKVETGGYAE